MSQNFKTDTQSFNGENPIPYGYPAEMLPSVGGAGTNSGGSLAGLFWRRKGIVLFFLLVGLGGGYYYFTQQPQVYQAAATVEVYSRQTSTGLDSAVEKVVETAPSTAFIKAEMTSDAVLRRAVEIGSLVSFEEMPSEPRAVEGLIRENLKLFPAIEGAESKERSIVLVTFESGSPTVATAVVNAVVEAYDEYINRKHNEAIEGLVGFFKEGRDSILPKLEELENKYTEFRRRAPLAWDAAGTAVNPYREEAIRLEETLRGYESDLRKVYTKMKLIEEASKTHSSALAILQEVQYLLDDVNGIGQMSDILASAPPAELTIQTKLMNLRVQAELLAASYAPNHPQRQAVERELEVTEKALRELEETRTTNAPEEVDYAKREEEAAKTILRSYVSGMRKKQQLIKEDIDDAQVRLTEVKTKAHEVSEYESENASLQRQISRYQGILDSFDEQLEKANIPSLEQGVELNTLRPAVMGTLVGPLLSRSLLMGGFLGALIGSFLGFLIDWSERTYRSPDEVAETLGLPIMTHLPLMLMGKKARRNSEEGDDLEKVDRVVTVMHDPHAPSSEAIRSVRTALFATPSKTAEYQIIQVTSALPGDGKSTVAANLAASVARANKRVLLIDADLRRPTQSSLFGIDREKGLTSVLNGDCEPDEAMEESAIEGLWVMPTGPKPSNPAEALMLPDFAQMLDDLRSEFDMIIVDTPPMLAVTDASNVATHVDGVMFVMRIGRNVKPMSKRAVTMLRALHVNIIGVIVNAIGDSGYSATYANAWSTSYGGQPGSEYGYGYYRYGSDRYLNASRSQSVVVRGKRNATQSGSLVGVSRIDASASGSTDDSDI